MSAKLVFLAVMAIIAGFSFIAAGIYFLSQKFLDKLNESAASETDADVVLRKNQFRAKGSGLTAVSLGVLTLVWALMLFSFPQIVPALALVYMIFLIGAFSALMVIFK